MVRLRARIGWLAGVGLAILAVAAAAVGSQFIEARDAASEFATRMQPAAVAADQLVLDIADLDRGLGNFVLTGSAADRAAYAAAANGSADQLELLGRLLDTSIESPDTASRSPGPDSDSARLSAELVAVVRARSNWLDDVADPTLAAMTAGRQGSALTAYDSPAADDRYRQLNSAAIAMQADIDTRRVDQFNQLTALSTRLLVALVGAGSALLLSLALAYLLIGTWVIKPIESLRFQLRRVAGEGTHEAPITPAGPPEITALGRDAEQMRRELVAETDEARAARAGLAQEGPTVATIRATLDRADALNSTVADVFGQRHPADGVLAGDWWDAAELDGDRLAIALFDVAGHGPTAAVVGLRLKTLTMAALASGDPDTLDLPGLTAVFDGSPASFATCLIIVFDRAASQLRWINAGHPEALILQADGAVAALRQTGPLLSGLGGRWPWQSVPVRPGDLLLAWTDGLTERRQDVDELSQASLIDTARTAMNDAHSDAREIAEKLLARARSLSAEWDRDDVTLVVAKLD